MSGPVTRLARLAACCLLALAAACGIQPTDVTDHGPAPVISFQPAFTTVYLLRNDHLVPFRVSAASTSIKDIMDSLFKASITPPHGLDSALRGFTHADSRLTRYGQPTRNDPDVPRGLRLQIFVRGDGDLSRAALAQLTCTATGLRSKEIWVVQVTQISSGGEPRAKGEHVCSEFRDIASPEARLPP